MTLRRLGVADRRSRASPATFVSAIDELIQKGFQFPIHFAAIAINGSVIAGVFKDAPAGERRDCEVLTKHILDAGFELPINVMYVDASGGAARMVIGIPPAAAQPKVSLVH
jgi:hypothetical protein